MTEIQFDEITDWQKETFVKLNAHSMVCHLRDEVEELLNELEVNNDKKAKELEFADCFILLFGAAKSDGMDYENICNAIENKMEINKKRKWGKPNENGVINHIR